MIKLDPGEVVTGAAREAVAKELVQRYEAGESVRQLAASLNRSYGFVHRVLYESGVEMRRRGGPRRRKTSSDQP